MCRPLSFQQERRAARDLRAWLETSEIFGGLAAEDIGNHDHGLGSQSTGILEHGHSLQASDHVLDVVDVAVLTGDDGDVSGGVAEVHQRVGDAQSGGVVGAQADVEGLAAGLVGVGMTLLLLIPTNFLVQDVLGLDATAMLPGGAAVWLVAISAFLTFIAGLIPARSAAKKDPVVALRTE